MARLLPIQGETEVPDSGPRVVDLEGEDADAVFSALSSDTARDIYRSLQEEPHTPSEIAEAADTSIQNVRYHLDNLEDAGLIEVVDTWYSSRGNEMSVYAPTSDALVLASGEEQTSRLKTALSRLVSGIVVLALASLASSGPPGHSSAGKSVSAAVRKGAALPRSPDPTSSRPTAVTVAGSPVVMEGPVVPVAVRTLPMGRGRRSLTGRRPSQGTSAS